MNSNMAEALEAMERVREEIRAEMRAYKTTVQGRDALILTGHKAGILKPEIADLMGVAPSTISRVERRHVNPKAGTVPVSAMTEE